MSMVLILAFVFVRVLFVSLDNKKTKIVQLTVRVPESVRENLSDIAWGQRVSVNQFLNTVFEDAIKAFKNKEERDQK